MVISLGGGMAKPPPGGWMSCQHCLAGAGRSDTLHGVRLRPARVSDVMDLRALDAACFGARAWSSRSWLEAVAGPEWTVLTLWVGTSLTAAMVLLPWPPVASLASVAVAPAWQRRGLGRRLIRHAQAILTDSVNMRRNRFPDHAPDLLDHLTNGHAARNIGHVSTKSMTPRNTPPNDVRDQEPER